jgi:hypothetical protein
MSDENKTPDIPETPNTGTPTKAESMAVKPAEASGSTKFPYRSFARKVLDTNPQNVFFSEKKDAAEVKCPVTDEENVCRRLEEIYLLVDDPDGPYTRTNVAGLPPIKMELITGPQDKQPKHMTRSVEGCTHYESLLAAKEKGLIEELPPVS